jgi:hypothetical protein
MKKFPAGFTLIIILGFLISACNKDNSTNPPVQNDTGYFPNGDGSTYTYSVQKTDSTGTQAAGTKSTEYSGIEFKNGTTYQVQIDSLNISGLSEISLSYFRKTNDTLYYFLDTTGLSAVFPDSLRNNISLDKEMKVLSFPVTENKSWPVFRLSIVFSIFNANVLTLDGSYDGTESVTLYLNSGDVTKDAVKLKYTLNLLPHGTLSTSTFTAYAWLAEGIGIVKWQGNAVILNALTGGGVNFSDTTSVITQSLISYDVRQ